MSTHPVFSSHRRFTTAAVTALISSCFHFASFLAVATCEFPALVTGYCHQLATDMLLSPARASSPQLITHSGPGFRFPRAINTPRRFLSSCLPLLTAQGRRAQNTTRKTSKVIEDNNSPPRGGAFTENITCATRPQEINRP